MDRHRRAGRQSIQTIIALEADESLQQVHARTIPVGLAQRGEANWVALDQHGLVSAGGDQGVGVARLASVEGAELDTPTVARADQGECPRDDAVLPTLRGDIGLERQQRGSLIGAVIR
jgi:hypothetical protein